MTWQPIKTAPTDGTPIQAKIPGHGSDNIIAMHFGFVDDEDRESAAWVYLEEGEAPDSWTDGVCWASNDVGKPSVQPTHWKPA